MHLNLTYLLPAAMFGFIASTSLHGDEFSYSYSFPSSYTVSGTFNGTQEGDYVDNISNVTVFFNGTQLPGSIYFASTSGGSSVPVVSFDLLNNDFMFSSTPLDGEFNDQFLCISPETLSSDNGYTGYQAEAWGEPISFGLDYNAADAGTWQLAQVSVPDGSMTAELLGIGLLALFAARRQKSRFRAGASRLIF